MGKVVKFTGSRLLGEELRRLRGGRTFDNIIELGRTKLLSHGFKAIARGTLCDIENGKALPNIESVFALSVLYQVPAARFIHFLLEENLAADVPAPTDEATLTKAFGEALQKAKWTDALGIAIQAQRLAASGWPSLRWKLNRALAMEKLGMRTDAINVLQECLESDDLPERERQHVHRELARMHDMAGQLRLSELHLEQSLKLLPADVAPTLKASLLMSLTKSALVRVRRSGAIPRPELVESERARIREARLLLDGGDDTKRVQLDLLEAAWMFEQRDGRHARKLLQAALSSARKLGLAHCQADALIMLADATDDAELQRKYLSRAAEIASEAQHVELAMTSLTKLIDVSDSPERRAHYMRRCEKLYPLLDTASEAARAFERLKAREVR